MFVDFKDCITTTKKEPNSSRNSPIWTEMWSEENKIMNRKWWENFLHHIPGEDDILILNQSLPSLFHLGFSKQTNMDNLKHETLEKPPKTAHFLV